MYPKIIDRVQSSAIDGLFVIILMCLTANILDRYENVPTWVRISIFIFLIIYEPLFIALGCTLGNYIKGIRVRKNSELEKKISLGRSLIRYPVKILLGLPSFLTVGSNPHRRAIHDLVSRSVMVNA